MPVAAKRVQVSSDNATYYTLPGNTGQLSLDGNAVDDTVFGQLYKSEQTTLINAQITAPAFYKGLAGYNAKLYKPGTSTALTTEPMTLVSGKTYEITNAAKRVINRTFSPINVFDNAVNANAEVLNFDYLFGRVTFKASYTVIGPVTITGQYYPMVQLAKANSFSLTQSADAVDTTDFETAQGNSGYRTFQAGLKTVNLETKGFYDVTNAFKAALEARTVLIIEVNPDGTGKSIARGFFIPMSDQLAGNVGALEEETVKWNLNVPSDDLMLAPFNWIHNATTLSTAVQKALAAWLAGDLVWVSYLPDGLVGFKTQAVVTNASLASSVEGINTFSFQFQMTGSFVAAP